MTSPLPSGRLVNPAPSGVEGRTDQGVDWSNIRGNILAVGSGVITNVYRGLSGFGTTIVERLSGTGTDVYYGEETGGGSPVVQAGQQVTAGQPLAPGLGSGGIEVGYWNPATGRALGAPGFTGSNPTAAGAAFRNAIGPSGGSSTVGGQQSSLAGLWIQAGGSPGLANTMSAIAMAESGGKVNAQNPSGAAGLWQILPSAHPQYNVQRLLSDPLYNARAAVAVEKSQGLGAWSTYTSGAYRQFLGQANTFVGYGGTRPGGQAAGGGGSGDVSQVFQDYINLRDMPRTAPPQTKNPLQWWLASFTGNWSAIGAEPAAAAPIPPAPQVPVGMGATTAGPGHQGLQ